MPHSIKTQEQLARGPFEVSDFPDLIPDSTVAFAACKAVPEIVDRKYQLFARLRTQGLAKNLMNKQC